MAITFISECSMDNYPDDCAEMLLYYVLSLIHNCKKVELNLSSSRNVTEFFMDYGVITSF